MHIRFYRRVQPFCGIEFITDYSTEIKEAKQTKKCTNIFTIVVITVCCVCIYSYTLLMLLLAYRIRVYIYMEWNIFQCKWYKMNLFTQNSLNSWMVRVNLIERALNIRSADATHLQKNNRLNDDGRRRIVWCRNEFSHNCCYTVCASFSGYDLLLLLHHACSPRVMIMLVVVRSIACGMHDVIKTRCRHIRPLLWTMCIKLEIYEWNRIYVK